MKYQVLLLFLLINFSTCEKIGSNKLSNDYIKAQDSAKKHEADIYKIFENATPKVKKTSEEFVTLFLNNNEEDFMKKSGKGKNHVRKVLNNINFFLDKIDEAKAFKPSPSQIAMYDRVRGFLEGNRGVVNKYINDNNPNFTHADNQRRRLYKNILDNDFYDYQNSTLPDDF